MIKAVTTYKKGREFPLICLPDSRIEPIFIAEVTAEGSFHLLDAYPAWQKLVEGCAELLSGENPGGCSGVDKASHHLFQQLHKYLLENRFDALTEGIPIQLGVCTLQMKIMPFCEIESRNLRLIGGVCDISKRVNTDSALKQVNRERQAIHGCIQALMQAENEESLLNDICRNICQVAGYRMAWVGFPDDNNKVRIKPVAWAGYEKGFLSTAGSSNASNVDRSTSVIEIIQDIKTDPRAAPWREQALVRGYQSNIALPLKNILNKTYGTLYIYAARAKAFVPEEIEFLKKLSKDVALGINLQRERHEHKRAETERLSNLRFFKSMDRVNRAIQKAAELEQMMSDVLDEMLEIFSCDRAYLLSPCDPSAATWQVPMERTRPAYPGALELGVDIDMTQEVATTFATLLANDSPVQFGPGKSYKVPTDIKEQFQVKSFMSMVIYPKVGKPWQFGIHQCSSVRKWSTDEERLLNEIGLRLADGLTSMLILRDLKESERKLREAERQFHTLVDNLPDNIVRFDWDGQVLLLNRAAIKTFNLNEEEVIGTMLLSHSPGNEFENRLITDKIRDAFNEAKANSLEIELQTGEGRRIFDVLHIPEMGEDNRVESVIGIGRDITQRKIIEEALRNSEERYRHIVNTASEGILVVDSDDITSFANERMTEMLGYNEQAILGHKVSDFLFTEDRALQREREAILRLGETDRSETRLRRGNGDTLWTLASASPVMSTDNKYMGAITLFTDITEHKQQQEQLLHQAHYDALTGLPNRFLAMDRLQQNIKFAARKGFSTALLFLDLDDFKKVNDALGHEVGDQVLRLAAARLKEAVRNSDTVARLGGDEFIVLIQEVSNSEAINSVAEKIIEIFQKVFLVMNRQVMLTASLGISVYPDDGIEPLVLLRNADTAMYHSKAIGRNTYQFFTEAMNLNVAHRLQLEEDLRLALERDELFLEYQPIIEVSSGRIIGVEALLRWHNDRLGKVPTTEFIEISEQTGLIIAIGEWVIGTALAFQGKLCEELGESFHMALNVSPRQFRQADFVNMLARNMEQNGVAGEQIELEITEGILLGDEVAATEVIAQLRKLGISISMDDFGTGYSSLSYLRNYHFDVLKIDREFIRDIIEDPSDRELVIATLRMARALGVKVVAEGVESAEQFEFLKQEGCDLVQGWYLSKSLSPAGLGEMLRSKKHLP
jgi:diguanylate cyclase (GGDEF)-like protein/PAS domain S-box-containing protein